MKLISLSENTLLVLFEQKIDKTVFQQVIKNVRKIESSLSPYIIDIIPAYASIHVLFNLTLVSHAQFKKQLSEIMATENPSTIESNGDKLITIPVYYGKETGLDIGSVAKSANLTIDDVIRIHSKKVYDVYAMGFAPGFAYLGQVDNTIATARKETPRSKVPAGSVGIAGQQTAVYPADSPGGWQIIGKTPQKLVDYDSDYLTLLEVGNRVKFFPIGREEYLQLGGVL